uniref:Uncharacterized protein n=1 Tax=Candidatus Kentrum sp. LPFa TaxID=2126335 RepID=A0A450VP36_9GAMM|nr:MAG: hypothetical protein BECKLPF1236A_GA0070988_1000330 [Candidatus Kentron sp. LPFa]VFK22940.1 MAG: hypothetical protein BECKLPF1236C_GA0070990_1000231 [Candidatus Kentron sp. LPFa]
MSVIPCQQNARLNEDIEKFAETLREKAHTLGGHGLSETEFHNSGLFRGAIESIRGQFSADKREKRVFVEHIFNHMQDHGYVSDWESAGGENRHDYSVTLKTGKTVAIELKGCLDGNNTTIFERPPHANEFIIWSVCDSPGADPRHNVWSGVMRLGAEIIFAKKQVDGIIIWDMMCGTIGKPCPKFEGGGDRATRVGPFKLPPPCIYLFPSTIPSPRNNPNPPAQTIADVEILQAFHECFHGDEKELSFVRFHVEHRGSNIVRTTEITRNEEIQKKSRATAIRRS